MTDICPHLNCLVHHGGNPCTCDMKRYCAICKKESEVPMTQPEGQPTTMTVREQIEEIFLLARANRADKWDEYIDHLESLISNAKEEGAIKRRNIYLFFAATIYRLNNPDTAMCIPNGIYISLQEKLSLLPTDRTITESEAMELVKGTPASLSSNNPKV